MKAKNLIHDQQGFEALLQSVTDYVIAINRDYKIIMANDLFKDEFGMHTDALCFKDWKNREEPCENCIVKACFQDGRTHQSDETVQMKDGRMAKLRVKATPVRNQQGKIVYVLETATDITEKERLQRELNRVAGNLEGMIRERLRYLEKSEERYRTIFERSSDAIILTDSNGKILEVNQAGIQILGYKKKEELMAVESLMDFFEDREVLYGLIKSLSQQGFVTDFEVRLLGKQGQGLDVLITSNVILDIIGQITGYVVIIRDISKRKMAQEQIQVQNIRLATLNAISTAISSSLDLDEVLNQTTGEIRDIIGSDCVRIYLLDTERAILNLAAYKGLSSEFVKKSHVRSRKVGDGFLGQTVQTHKVQVVDNLLPSADPYVNHLVREGFKSTAYIPLLSRGESIGAMCVSSHAAFKFSPDFIEFLKAIGNQIGVAVHKANLYEDLKKAYQELKDAQEQVIRTEKLASLGKLSATIAHEINNPIAAVLTYVRLLMKLLEMKRFTTERVEDISRYLNTMDAEISRCGEIVKNLLAFSRQSKIRMKPHSIEEVVERTLMLIAHDLELKGIRLVKNIEANLPHIQCDFMQIQQALLNVMSNASEAMTKGGTLSIEVMKSNEDGFIDVVIQDTGCGIPKEDLKNIFEPFFTTKEEGKGVGLGLSVAYGIITKHQGAIEVGSKPGQGSAFTIRLPKASM
ncbi:MAG: PAS domain S-box protein [Desulfobacteraceae bacterium]